MKDQIESQYGNARTNIIGDTPAGGALTSALVDLERGRAGSLTQGAGTVAGIEADQAMALATGQTGTAVGAAGSAAAAQAQRAQAAAEQEAGLYGALGGGLGAFLGGGGFGDK
jgi:hypothetical protein